MKLFLISLGTLGITLMIGLIARFWGLSLPYKKFEHPFFQTTQIDSQPLSIPVLNEQHFELVTGSLTDPTSVTKTPPAQTHAFKFKLHEPARLVLWINVYLTSDRKLISDFGFNVDTFMEKQRAQNKFKGKFVHNYTLAEITESVTPITTLDEVIKSFPGHQFVLNILTNETNVHKDVVEFIETNKLSDHVLINSTIDVVIKSIKEQKPMWIYGTSIPEASRVKSFSTLGLEAAISVRGDVFIAPISYLNRPMINESLVTEMKRRKKYVLIGPVLNDEERKQAEELNPDGIIF
ncbi:MAG: hypothetical protein JNL11_14605 [Bdellovibrionaceae bacterium]|nr:hypothetical protein [Pseudobdellovibrionaceae bacterium]